MMSSGKRGAEAPKATAAIVTFNSDPAEVVVAAKTFLDSPEAGELCIVDNGSTNGLLETIREALPDVKLVESGRNGGFGFGHNVALRSLPNRPFHLVLNPDVELHVGALETLIEFMETHPEVVVSGPRVLNPDGTLQPLNKRNPTVLDLFLRRFLPSTLRTKAVRRRLARFSMEDVGYEEVTRVESLSGCCMLFRRDALAELGGFDERFFLYFEDADLTRRANQRGQAVYVPDAVVTHEWTRGSHTDAELTWVTVRSAVKYFQKWGWRIW